MSDTTTTTLNPAYPAYLDSLGLVRGVTAEVRDGGVVITAAARPTRIECAALLTEDGQVVSLPRPARHHDVIQHMTRQGFTPEAIARSEQGFTTDTLRFVRRKPALRIAWKADQLIKETAPAHGLFSEDVW
jgi:hypothetical protein